MRILLTLFAFLALLAVVELSALGFVASLIGLYPTLTIALGTGVLGAFIAKENAKVAIKDLLDGNTVSGPPGKHIVDTVAFLMAAVLLIIPGLVTDIAGLTLLLPPTRTAIFAWLKRKYRESTNAHMEIDLDRIPMKSEDAIDIKAESADCE